MSMTHCALPPNTKFYQHCSTLLILLKLEHLVSILLSYVLPYSSDIAQTDLSSVTASKSANDSGKYHIVSRLDVSQRACLPPFAL